MNLLIAEDEKATRIRLKSQLEKMGFGVVAAQDGAEAWELFQSGDFSMVVSDWVMPNMTGPELVHQIRQSDHKGYVYVILLTAKAGTENVVEGMEAGADDFLAKPFDKDELRVRVRAGERIVNLERDLDLRNAELAEAHAELLETHKQMEAANKRMKDDLMAAARIQQAYLPDRLPTYEELSFAWDFQPCDELAGDMLNVIPFDDETVGIYVLDVSGHGVKAALLAVTLSRMLSLDSESVIREPLEDAPGFRILSPCEVAQRLNEQFDDIERTGQFFTLFYGLYNIAESQFRFVSAGHPRPMLLSRGEPPRRIEITGYPIGTVQGIEFEEQSMSFKSGDRFFIYTDGVIESHSPSHELFGEKRLLELLHKNHSQPLEQSVLGISAAIENWRGSDTASDDVSVLAFEVI